MLEEKILHNVKTVNYVNKNADSFKYRYKSLSANTNTVSVGHPKI